MNFNDLNTPLLFSPVCVFAAGGRIFLFFPRSEYHPKQRELTCNIIVRQPTTGSLRWLILISRAALLVSNTVNAPLEQSNLCVSGVLQTCRDAKNKTKQENNADLF